MRLSTDEFCDLVRRVVDELPPEFHDRMENLVIDVELRPSRNLLLEVGIDRPDQTLMGLFVGRSLPEQEFGEHTPNHIFIFQRPIEDVCRSRAEIAYEVRRTLLHELAHHFGYSEEDLDFFEAQPSPFDDLDNPADQDA
jgi:predicted Zn-dependent protease with MMP-like domain